MERTGTTANCAITLRRKAPVFLGYGCGKAGMVTSSCASDLVGRRWWHSSAVLVTYFSGIAGSKANRIFQEICTAGPCRSTVLLENEICHLLFQYWISTDVMDCNISDFPALS